MVTAKATTLTFRIEPGLKEALCMAAEREHRSIANATALRFPNRAVCLMTDSQTPTAGSK